MTDVPTTAIGRDQSVEDALTRISECLSYWPTPGRIVVSFRRTRDGWADDWVARFSPDPVCESCGQNIEDPMSAPVS